MDLDDFKKGYQALSYQGQKIDSLDLARYVECAVDAIRVKDREMLKGVRMTFIILAFFIVLFCIRGLFPYLVKHDINHALFSFVLPVPLMYSMFFLIWKYRILRGIRHDAPTTRFLLTAEKRHNPLHSKHMWSFIPLFILIEFWCFLITYLFPEPGMPMIDFFLLSQVIVVIPGLVVASIIMLITHNKNKGFLNELRRIRQSLEEQ